MHHQIDVEYSSKEENRAERTVELEFLVSLMIKKDRL